MDPFLALSLKQTKNQYCFTMFCYLTHLMMIISSYLKPVFQHFDELLQKKENLSFSLIQLLEFCPNFHGI